MRPADLRHQPAPILTASRDKVESPQLIPRLSVPDAAVLCSAALFCVSRPDQNPPLPTKFSDLAALSDRDPAVLEKAKASFWRSNLEQDPVYKKLAQ